VPPERLQQHAAMGLAWAYGINNPDAHDPGYWRDICSPEYRRWAGLGKKLSVAAGAGAIFAAREGRVRGYAMGSGMELGTAGVV